MLSAWNNFLNMSPIILRWLQQRVLHLMTSLMQGHNKKIFWGGKVIFPDFFPKCFFPVENFHFGRPKTNFSGFEKWKEKERRKKKKRPSPHFVTFPPSIFYLPFTFSIFTPFPFFPCLFFPGRSAEISRSEVGGGVHHWINGYYLPKITSSVGAIYLRLNSFNSGCYLGWLHLCVRSPCDVFIIVCCLP